ncbi:hypothetical protein AgCh_002142 [Apium graveolens]
MGTTAHCKSYTPGYYSRDMNEDSNSSSWSPFHRDKNLLNGHYYNGFVQRTVRDDYEGYEKDVLKQKMMEHEMVFKHQVYELHRLYRVQREMMEEAKRKELYNHHRSVEASSSSSIIPSQMSSDEVRNWHTSSFPLASPGCIRPSILGFEVIDSPLSCTKGHNSRANLVPYQNNCDLKERALIDSRPSKARKKLFDLQIPAEKYIVIEDEEQFQDTEMSNNLTNHTDGNHRLAPGNSIKKYIGGGTMNGLKDNSSSKIPMFADLNEPIQVEESDSPKFVDFSNRSACHEEIRGLDFSAKPKSQFIDLSRDTLQNSQCGSNNGNYCTSSESNKGSGRGWLSYMYDAGNRGTDANCIPKFHQSERFPTTSQKLPFMPGRPNQPRGILPNDFVKDEPWTEKNRSYEFSNRSHGHSNYNRSGSVVTSHLSNPYPWYNSSDVTNSWSPSVTSWAKPKPSSTQVALLHTGPSVISSETWSRDIDYKSSLNPGLRSKLSTASGFGEDSSASKELSTKLSSISYNNKKCAEIDIIASKHLRNHGPQDVPKDSDVMDSKSGKDLDLNVVLPIDLSNEDPLLPGIDISDGKKKLEDHFTALPWLRGKPVGNNVSMRKYSESGLLQASGNPLLQDETVKDPNFPFTRNLSAGSSICHVRENRESASAALDNGKLLGFSIFGKLCTSKNDSSSTSASVQSYPHNAVSTKNERKHRGFDINVACDLLDGEFDKQIVVEAISSEKGMDIKSNSFRNFDLNSCVSVDEDPLDSSLASNSRKVKIALEIDLEAPAVPETVEALCPGEKQFEVSLQLPLLKTEQQGDQFVRIAAEAIVSISSYSQDPRFECTNLDPSELPDPLTWFADVICSSAEDIERKLCKDKKGRNGRETETLRELDEYEIMTLQLTETREEDYMPEPFVPEIHNSEVGATSIPSRTRKGPARRGRMRKDFQRDVLPGLVSLSRHEVTEDLQTFGGLMRATGYQWHGAMARRNGTRSGTARGRRRCVVEPSPDVVVVPVRSAIH